MLTTFDLDEYVYEAMRAGASGFLLKDARREQLAAAIRTVVEGETLIDPAVTRRLVEDFCRRPPPTTGVPAAAQALTERELEVARAVARGLSNAQIARELYFGETTFKSHVANILATEWHASASRWSIGGGAAEPTFQRYAGYIGQKVR